MKLSQFSITKVLKSIIVIVGFTLSIAGYSQLTTFFINDGDGTNGSCFNNFEVSAGSEPFMGTYTAGVSGSLNINATVQLDRIGTIRWDIQDLTGGGNRAMYRNTSSAAIPPETGYTVGSGTSEEAMECGSIRVTSLAVLAPNANAGDDQSVREGDVVTLDASASTDNGTIVSYTWTQTVGPTVTIANASTVTTTFTVPDVNADTMLIFNVEVTDDGGLSGNDTVTISVTNNTAPVFTSTPNNHLV